MEKTPTNGYYELKIPEFKENLNKDGILINNDKIEVEKSIWLHFSMNTWYNLNEDTGKDITDYSTALQHGTDVEKAFALAEIIFAAAKSYAQEEDIEIDFNIYKIRGWFGSVINEEQIQGITKAIMWNSDSGKKAPEGKKKGKK